MSQSFKHTSKENKLVAEIEAETPNYQAYSKGLYYGLGPHVLVVIKCNNK